ncbi:MAG: hypothetical protein QMD09_05570 [Desulfatibacillaceae bacterium]|nr:hypothetical protein [Desulfatibacillaceae bacterium]
MTMYSPGPFTSRPEEIELAHANRYISPHEYLWARAVHSWEENLASLFYRSARSYIGLEDKQARQDFLRRRQLRQEMISRFDSSRGYDRLGWAVAFASNLADPVGIIPFVGIAGKATLLGRAGIKSVSAATRSGRLLSGALTGAADHVMGEGLAAAFAGDQLADINMPVGSQAWKDRLWTGAVSGAAFGGLSAGFPRRPDSVSISSPSSRQKLRPGFGLPVFGGPHTGLAEQAPLEQGEHSGPPPHIGSGLGLGKALWDMERGRPVSVSLAMTECRMPQALHAAPIWDRVEHRPTLYGSALHYAAHANIQ